MSFFWKVLRRHFETHTHALLLSYSSASPKLKPLWTAICYGGVVSLTWVLLLGQLLDQLAHVALL